jgi:hypothetical protein
MDSWLAFLILPEAPLLSLAIVMNLPWLIKECLRCTASAPVLVLLQVGLPGSCPYRPAEKHVHNDATSNYGAGGSWVISSQHT